MTEAEIVALVFAGSLVVFTAGFWTCRLLDLWIEGSPSKLKPSRGGMPRPRNRVSRKRGPGAVWQYTRTEQAPEAEQ